MVGVSKRQLLVLTAMLGACGGAAEPLVEVGHWAPMSMVGAPSVRGDAAAVDGRRDADLGRARQWRARRPINLADGAAYDPVTDSWRPVASVPFLPVPPSEHAIWTGTSMVVLGASAQEDRTLFWVGGRYNLASDSWLPMSLTGAPAARLQGCSVWTGHELLVWGGFDGERGHADGGAYDPATDTWRSLSTVGAPTARTSMACLWTGEELVISGGLPWGGQALLRDGAAYDPASDGWQAIADAPAAFGSFGSDCWLGHEAVTVTMGSYLHASALHYDPASDAWSTSSTAAETHIRGVTGCAGDRLYSWSGYTSDAVDGTPGTGLIYDAMNDAWAAMSTEGAPRTEAWAPPAGGPAADE